MQRQDKKYTPKLSIVVEEACQNTPSDSRTYRICRDKGEAKLVAANLQKSCGIPMVVIDR